METHELVRIKDGRQKVIQRGSLDEMIAAHKSYITRRNNAYAYVVRPRVVRIPNYRKAVYEAR